MWIMGELEFGNNSVNLRGGRVTMLQCYRTVLSLPVVAASREGYLPTFEALKCFTDEAQHREVFKPPRALVVMNRRPSPRRLRVASMDTPHRGRPVCWWILNLGLYLEACSSSECV